MDRKYKFVGLRTYEADSDDGSPKLSGRFYMFLNAPPDSPRDEGDCRVTLYLDKELALAIVARVLDPKQDEWIEATGDIVANLNDCVLFTESEENRMLDAYNARLLDHLACGEEYGSLPAFSCNSAMVEWCEEWDCLHACATSPTSTPDSEPTESG